MPECPFHRGKFFNLADRNIQLADSNWIVPEIVVAAKIVGNILKTTGIVEIIPKSICLGLAIENFPGSICQEKVGL